MQTDTTKLISFKKFTATPGESHTQQQYFDNTLGEILTNASVASPYTVKFIVLAYGRG